jgi:hypothetical protein
VGCSLSLVASHKDKIHFLIVEKLGVQFEKVANGRLMRGAQERVNMATKVVTAQDIEDNRSQRQN